MRREGKKGIEFREQRVILVAKGRHNVHRLKRVEKKRKVSLRFMLELRRKCSILSGGKEEYPEARIGQEGGNKNRKSGEH